MPEARFASTHSLIGTGGALLLSFVRHVSTFLPTFPQSGFASRTSRGLHPDHSGTMRALTPAGFAHTAGLSVYFASPSEHPVPNHVVMFACRFRRHFSACNREVIPGFATIQLARHITPPPARVGEPTWPG